MCDSIKKIIYIANARLPTEKAHGYQICKMCEAFAHSGYEVQLWHPIRAQPDPNIREKTVFDYYGIRRNFFVRSIANHDIIRLESFLPKRIFDYVFFLHALLWGLYVARLARNENADLYFTRDSEVAYWLIRLGLPTIHEEHVVPGRAQQWLLSKISHRSNIRLVVGLNSFIRKCLVEMGFSETKAVFLPNGADLSLFTDLPSKSECRNRLGLPQNRLIIGYCGRFRTMEMEKGIPEMIQAMAHLPLLNGEQPLLLCVGGPMDVVPTYLNIAKRCEVAQQRLQFVDRVPNCDIPFWIRTFDIAAAPFPSTEYYAYSMSPIKIFEYMAAGVPIVATNLPSIREVLQHGKNAWLVEPGDGAALAAGITRVLSDVDLKSEIAVEAEKSAMKYSWAARADSILSLAKREERVNL